MLSIKLYASTPYKKGILKIVDENKDKLVCPSIRLPNILFTKRDKVESIDELDNLKEFNIYFKTGDYNTIHLYSINLDIIDKNIRLVSNNTIERQINLWRLRKLFDLEFINYYLNNLGSNNTLIESFIDRFNSEYQLSKNLDTFDRFISDLDLILDPNDKIELIPGQTSVLYLVHSNIEYENIGYSIRTHNLLSNANSEKFKVYGVTRYGYPYDKKLQYNINNNTKINTINVIDDVTYFKLLDGEDNYNTNTLKEYLKKYIIETIKLAYRLNAKVIHATTNFWNGIAAVYASKYLNIKSVYEVRNVWEESTLAFSPELYDSDILKMRSALENKVLNMADQVLTINDILKKNLELELDNKDVKVIPNAVDADKFKSNSVNRDNLLKEHNLSKYDCIIGYIGSILNYEGIEYIVGSISKLKIKHNINIKLVMLGDGNYKDYIHKYVSKLGLDDNMLYLGKKNNNEIIQYYDLFDMVVYPRKNLTVCNTTSSSKVIEALAMGKPLIVSDLPAWKDVIIEGKTGIYCKADDVDDLTDKILNLYKDHSLQESLGKNAREWVINNRDWKIVGLKLQNIYSAIIS